MISFGALRPYAQGPRRARRLEGETCELCGVPVQPDHPHVVDRERRHICCACRACALLFMEPVAARGRYRTVPDRVLRELDFTLSEADWARLEIPVRLAFFFFNSALDRWVAFYPSPAGATESELGLGMFEDVRRRSVLARCIEPDVEALIAYAPRGEESFIWYLVPIDRCYELVGRVRVGWRGFTGGPEAQEAIAEFFRQLAEESRPVKRGGDQS